MPLLISQMFPSKWLQAEDLPPGQIVTVTIERIFMGDAKASRDGGEAEIKWKIRFREQRKPMGLWTSNARIIGEMYGEDAEKWVGKRIGIYAATYPSYGEQKPCINVDKWTPDQVRSYETKAVVNGAPGLVISGDKRPVPAEAMQRFMKFAEAYVPKGASVWDAFLGWCRLNCPEALTMCYGVPLADIPAGVLPAMKAFLDHLAKPPALDTQKATPDVKLPTAGAGREVINTVSGEVVIQGAPAKTHTPPPIDEADIPF